ncbi:Myb DNA-bind 3 domain-containing protein [Abeliophyllum distichum]|uniref:Myb DNA-bind 3 domain-containing protein n=1 Tax=Abeliophyllum distichum TaxID=126358 RepID=A0ABD1TXH7_9LAMI
MGGHRGKTKEPMSWSDENEHAFIGILYDIVKSGKLQCSTFTKDEWGKINKDMGIHVLHGIQIPNQVNAAEEVWQHFYTINKTEYRTFRKEGCKHYELLGEIFGGTTATGGLGNASTQLPPTSDEERQLEDDFLSRGVHVHVENDDDDEITNTRRRDDGTSNERQT